MRYMREIKLVICNAKLLNNDIKHFMAKQYTRYQMINCLLGIIVLIILGTIPYELGYYNGRMDERHERRLIDEHKSKYANM